MLPIEQPPLCFSYVFDVAIGKYGNFRCKAISGNYIFNTVGQLVNNNICLLYTSDAADERSSVDLGGRRIIKKKSMI